MSDQDKFPQQQPVLNCQQLSKTFHDGLQDITVLKDIELSIMAGERVAIIGASGSGKSTLMHLLGGLDIPSAGQVSVMGQTLQRLSQRRLGQLRNQYLGFVYQFHHLLPEFTALENVAFPCLLSGLSLAQARQKAVQLLDKVGLAQRLSHKPSQLSGGERQRTAIARALVNDPVCVLADEPTGNLDRQTAAQVQQLIETLNEQLNISFLVVTHDQHWAQEMDRSLQLIDGQLAAMQ